jgi:hypothetical protein
MLRESDFLDTYDRLSELNSDKETVEINPKSIDYVSVTAALKEVFGSATPQTKSCFITPDGYFLNVPYRHWDVLPELVKKGIIATPEVNKTNIDTIDDIGPHIDKLLGCSFEEFFSNKLNYIRCNGDPAVCYIGLPDKRPTGAQFESTELWLTSVVYNDSNSKRNWYETIELWNVAGTSQLYKVSEYFPEDIIKRIKRYYASGRFYEHKI